MLLSDDIYPDREQYYFEHYISGVNIDNTWILISDTRILKQQKL